MGLDTVEILIGWESAFGIGITDEEAIAIATPQLAADLISTKVSISSNPSAPCLSLKAFNRLRRSIKHSSSANTIIRPSTRLRDFLPPNRKRQTWKTIKHHSALPLREPLIGYSTKLEDIILNVVAYHPRAIKCSSEWSMAEILTVVRASVWIFTGSMNFTNTDHFIKDIGLD